MRKVSSFTEEEAKMIVVNYGKCFPVIEVRRKFINVFNILMRQQHRLRSQLFSRTRYKFVKADTVQSKQCSLSIAELTIEVTFCQWWQTWSIFTESSLKWRKIVCQETCTKSTQWMINMFMNMLVTRHREYVEYREKGGLGWNNGRKISPATGLEMLMAMLWGSIGVHIIILEWSMNVHLKNSIYGSFFVGRKFVWFIIKRKTVTTITFLWIWKELQVNFSVCIKTQTPRRQGWLEQDGTTFQCFSLWISLYKYWKNISISSLF